LTLAEKLLSLYFAPGSSYYQSRVNVPRKVYLHIRSAVTADLILAHLTGEVSIGAPSTHKGMTMWVSTDIDTLTPGLVLQAKALLREKGFPAYPSVSGGGGYHLTVFLDGPTPLVGAQTVSRTLKQAADSVGLDYCKISPSPYGKGGDCMKLPLGVHPETGNRCHFLDDDLNPVKDALGFIVAIERARLDNTPEAQTPQLDRATGEILSTPLPEAISGRSCVDKLWREGIQAPNTRHSATNVIVNVCRASNNGTHRGS
jgi:hypothetical protein